MTNFLILNLRSQAQAGEPTTLSTRTDMFFRNAYGRSLHSDETHTIMFSILGNIGEPLKVENENDTIDGGGTMELGRIPDPRENLDGGEQLQNFMNA